MSKKKNKKVSDAPAVKPQPKEVVPGGEGDQKSPEAPKKENNGSAVVLKLDLHCDGCANKVVKFIHSFPGVVAVKVDGPAGKVTVNGKADPVELRAKLEEKTHKKVELLSPVPKKENAKGKDGNGDKVKGSKDESNKKEKKDDDNGKDGKAPKSKEPAVTTAVMKVPLHCEGCIHKIYKIVSKAKGYEEIKVDKEKDLVTVKGAMDIKALAENLKKRLKRAVEIVPPPKKDEKKETGGGDGKAKAAAATGGANGGEKMEGNKMQVQPYFGYGMAPQPEPAAAYGFGYPLPVGDPYQIHYDVHAPQMFSDENPNACSVM